MGYQQLTLTKWFILAEGESTGQRVLILLLSISGPQSEKLILVMIFVLRSLSNRMLYMVINFMVIRQFRVIYFKG